MPLLGRSNGNGAFKLKFKVTQAQTVTFQRHPHGALDKWVKGGSQGSPPREDVPLVYAHLEAVSDHGDTTVVHPDSGDVHAIGGLDVRSIHRGAEAHFKVGKTFLLSFEEA